MGKIPEKHYNLCNTNQQDGDDVCTCDIFYERNEHIKELFDMVYQWGRVGIVTDHEAPAFRSQLDLIVRENS